MTRTCNALTMLSFLSFSVDIGDGWATDYPETSRDFVFRVSQARAGVRSVNSGMQSSTTGTNLVAPFKPSLLATALLIIPMLFIESVYQLTTGVQ